VFGFDVFTGRLEYWLGTEFIDVIVVLFENGVEFTDVIVVALENWEPL